MYKSRKNLSMTNLNEEKTRVPTRKMSMPLKKEFVSTSKMVLTAIENKSSMKGLSFQGIKKFISEKYDADITKMSNRIKKFLKLSVESGTVIQTTGSGAVGSFKLPKKEFKKPIRPDSVGKNVKEEKHKQRGSLKSVKNKIYPNGKLKFTKSRISTKKKLNESKKYSKSPVPGPSARSSHSKKSISDTPKKSFKSPYRTQSAPTSIKSPISLTGTNKSLKRRNQSEIDCIRTSKRLNLSTAFTVTNLKNSNLSLQTNLDQSNKVNEGKNKKVNETSSALKRKKSLANVKCSPTDSNDNEKLPVKSTSSRSNSVDQKLILKNKPKTQKNQQNKLIKREIKDEIPSPRLRVSRYSLSHKLISKQHTVEENKSDISSNSLNIDDNTADKKSINANSSFTNSKPIKAKLIRKKTNQLLTKFKKDKDLESSSSEETVQLDFSDKPITKKPKRAKTSNKYSDKIENTKQVELKKKTFKTKLTSSGASPSSESSNETSDKKTSNCTEAEPEYFEGIDIDSNDEESSANSTSNSSINDTITRVETDNVTITSTTN